LLSSSAAARREAIVENLPPQQSLVWNLHLTIFVADAIVDVELCKQWTIQISKVAQLRDDDAGAMANDEPPCNPP
jgi:hypothetical protein